MGGLPVHARHYSQEDLCITGKEEMGRGRVEEGERWRRERAAEEGMDGGEKGLGMERVADGKSRGGVSYPSPTLSLRVRWGRIVQF